MGLDLVLYKKIKPIREMTFEEEQNAELAYGRKTWSIADFFTRRCKMIEDDWLYEVTKEDWDAFMKAFNRLEDPDFRQGVEAFIEFGRIAEFGDEGYEEYEKAYKVLMDWFVEAADYSYKCLFQLGFEWELRTLLSWYDANEKVQQAFADGYTVELVQSY